MQQSQQPGFASRAANLLQENRPAEARSLLERGAEAGDRASAFILGEVLLRGQPFGRDLAASRRWFGRAAELGDRNALDTLIAFTANGTGGSRDWQGALGMLHEHAEIADYRRQLEVIEAMPLTDSGEPAVAPESEPVGELPHARRFPRFLTPAECKYLIEAAEPMLQVSTVIDRLSGKPVVDPIRRSDVAAFPLALERPFIHAINLRIAQASGTQVGQGEPLQILRYAPGQEYKRHLDAIPAAENQREFTFLVYLNAGYSGGETVFPEADLSHRGETGDALMFRNITDDGQPDPRTVHMGMPVTAGVKYLASRWIRNRVLDLSL